MVVLRAVMVVYILALVFKKPAVVAYKEVLVAHRPVPLVCRAVLRALSSPGGGL